MLPHALRRFRADRERVPGSGTQSRRDREPQPSRKQPFQQSAPPAKSSSSIGSSPLGFVGQVAVIAPSVSTSMKAREIRADLGLSEVQPKRANFVLVVVRSMLFDPLSYSYDSFGHLKEDADMQLNISGSNYHLYFYEIRDDLSVTQIKHTSFSAGDD